MQQALSKINRRKSKDKSPHKRGIKIMIEEDDVVLCTVKRIEGTTVFLDIEANGSTAQGAMIFAEVSAGRIRNIREFVVPGKKVVCKVLRIRENNIELSLRRVTGKEREEILEKYKKERQFQSMLKPVLKDKTQEIFDKIKASYDIPDFIEEARKSPKLLEKFVSKPEAEQLSKILAEKKEKEKEVSRTIIIKSFADDGIKKIKSVLGIKNAEIRYRGSSQFMIKVRAKDFKTANNQLEAILDEIRQKAKSNSVKLEIREK